MRSEWLNDGDVKVEEPRGIFRMMTICSRSWMDADEMQSGSAPAAAAVGQYSWVIGERCGVINRLNSVVTETDLWVEVTSSKSKAGE